MKEPRRTYTTGVRGCAVSGESASSGEVDGWEVPALPIPVHVRRAVVAGGEGRIRA